MLYYKKVKLKKGTTHGQIQVLAIVLPVVFALVIGFFYNNSRLNDVNSEVEDVNQRFDDVNRRIDDLRSEMNQRFAIFHEAIHEIKSFMMEFLKKESAYLVRDKQLILAFYKLKNQESKITPCPSYYLKQVIFFSKLRFD